MLIISTNLHGFIITGCFCDALGALKTANSCFFETVVQNSEIPHPEMPVLTIASESELQVALLRVRALEAASPHSAEALEREALQQAVATYRSGIDGTHGATEGER